MFQDNFTALHIAVEAVRPNVVETLLGYGAQVHIKGVCVAIKNEIEYENDTCCRYSIMSAICYLLFCVHEISLFNLSSYLGNRVVRVRVSSKKLCFYYYGL